MKKPDWNLWVKDAKDCKFWLEGYIKKGMLVKSNREERLYFGKAGHNLNFANWLDGKQDELRRLFDDTFYDWVVVGYYYSIYHAALSLVSRLRHKSKSHTATLCFIIYHYFHNKKLLEEEHIELLADAIEKEDIESVAKSKSLRERASYDVGEIFEKQLAENSKAEAVKFLEKVRTILGL